MKYRVSLICSRYVATSFVVRQQGQDPYASSPRLYRCCAQRHPFLRRLAVIPLHAVIHGTFKMTVLPPAEGLVSMSNTIDIAEYFMRLAD